MYVARCLSAMAQHGAGGAAFLSYQAVTIGASAEKL
jgi:hypothetical protein